MKVNKMIKISNRRAAKIRELNQHWRSIKDDVPEIDRKMGFVLVNRKIDKVDGWIMDLVEDIGALNAPWKVTAGTYAVDPCDKIYLAAGDAGGWATRWESVTPRSES